MEACPKCGSESTVQDLYDTLSYEDEDGTPFYVDIIVYTCQSCGHSWELEDECFVS